MPTRTGLETYILAADGKTPVEEPDIRKWGAWFERRENRIVRQETIGTALISTMFLGTDHNWWNLGDPVLWETMVFNGPYDEYQERYSSHEDAIAGHERIAALVRAAGA